MLPILLITIPLILALVSLFSSGRLPRTLSILALLINLGITLVMAVGLKGTGLQYLYKSPWIAEIGSSFYVGVDGWSIVFLLLTYICGILIIATHDEPNRPHLFYALILFFMSALSGVFLSLDALLYYIFWELSLIPIFAILMLWGQGSFKTFFTFFLYTVAGSLLMLVSILILQHASGSFAIDDFIKSNLSVGLQSIALLGFCAAYFIKIPVFPLHTWLPDTYTKASYTGTMLLAAIMLKMALYSLIRWVLPVCGGALADFHIWLMILACIGVVYASIIALTQTDLKRMLAYSSMAHVGMIAAGILSLQQIGIQGAALQSFNHGIIAIGLFYTSSIIFKRLGTHDMDSMGGLRSQAPILATLFMIILLASIALPLTNGFVGEFMLLKSIFDVQPVLAAFAGLSVILGAAYMLRTYRLIMLGENKNNLKINDVTREELYVLIPIIILIFVLGLYPTLLTQFLNN